VLLRNGADSVAAKAFLAFMMGAEATKVIEKFGYGTN
jgi:ABC-type Fe3+ transport system substrate-binding protein